MISSELLERLVSVGVAPGVVNYLPEDKVLAFGEKLRRFLSAKTHPDIAGGESPLIEELGESFVNNKNDPKRGEDNRVGVKPNSPLAEILNINRLGVIAYAERLHTVSRLLEYLRATIGSAGQGDGGLFSEEIRVFDIHAFEHVDRNWEKDSSMVEVLKQRLKEKNISPDNLERIGEEKTVIGKEFNSIFLQGMENGTIIKRKGEERLDPYKYVIGTIRSPFFLDRVGLNDYKDWRPGKEEVFPGVGIRRDYPTTSEEGKARAYFLGYALQGDLGYNFDFSRGVLSLDQFWWIASDLTYKFSPGYRVFTFNFEPGSTPYFKLEGEIF